MACAAEWEDAVLAEPPGTGWELLWTCDSMAATQDELGALRSRLHAVIDSGKAVKASCATNSRPCSEELTRLREVARNGKLEEDMLRDRLGKLAAGCPAQGWERLVEFRKWTSRRDSACTRISDSGCKAILEWIAQSAWKASLLSGHEDARAFDALHQALEQRDLPRRDAAQLRLAILLARKGSRDSARALREAIIGAAQDPHIRAAAHLWKGVDSTLPAAERLRHLGLARTDSSLAPRAMAEIANLLESSGHAREAADTLASWIRTTGSARKGPDPLRHLAALTRKAGIHPDSFQLRLGSPRPRWADTLYLFQAREELAAGELQRGMSMLAGFHLRFPGSSLGPSARDLLAKARRRDPEVVGAGR